MRLGIGASRLQTIGRFRAFLCDPTDLDLRCQGLTDCSAKRRRSAFAGDLLMLGANHHPPRQLPRPSHSPASGRITLPAAIRQRFGIKPSGVVILQDRGSEIVLKPGMTLEVQHYNDDQIAHWHADDGLEDR